MRTVTILAIAVFCAIGVIALISVVGGMYQQELFEEYMEDIHNSAKPNFGPSNLPSLDIP